MPQLPLAARVVEVIADRGEGRNPRYRFGSGCVVVGRTVLTAAHVVAGAVGVWIRGPDKVAHQAALDPKFIGDPEGPGPDLALVEIIAGPVNAPAMGLAAVDRNSPSADPVEQCHVIGYPAFKERHAPDGGRFRETVDAVGHVPVLSGLAGGLLSVQVTNTPQPLPPAQVALGDSPWSGISGAPVVASGYLLAVVTEHAPREGSSAITATPLTALDSEPTYPGWGPGLSNSGAWWNRLGVPGPKALKLLPDRQPGANSAAWAHGPETSRVAAAHQAPWCLAPATMLRELLTAQHRARETVPYRLLTGQIPPLSSLYVEQDVERSRIGSDGSRAPALSDLKPLMSRSMTIATVLSMHRHIVITAEPGGGKSTLLYQLIAQSTDWWLGQTNDNVNWDQAPMGSAIPIRVPAQLLVGRSLPEALAASVVAELGEYLDVPPPDPSLFTQPPMDSGSWLVMVDGLDEILDRISRYRVIEAIAQRVKDGSGHFRFLITSRPLVTGDLEPLNNRHVGLYVLQRFDDQRLRDYAQNWFSTRSFRVAEEETASFLDLLNHSRLLSIVSIPLLATIALIVYEQGTKQDRGLPTGRAGLYSEFVDFLLNVRQDTVQTRRAFREQLAPYAHGEQIAEWCYDNLLVLLEELASYRLSSGNSSLEDAAAAYIDSHLSLPTNRIPDWKGRLRRLLTSTGLLIERGNSLDFLHRSFAEYLAAADLAHRLPSTLSASSIDEIVQIAFPLSTRNLGLFAIGRWSLGAPNRDASVVIDGLIEAGSYDDVLLASDILSFGVSVDVDSEMAIGHELTQMALSDTAYWPYALSALAAQPNRKAALRWLKELALGELGATEMRIKAGRLLVELGDRKHGVLALTTIATVATNIHTEYPSEAESEPDTMRKRPNPLRHQALMLQWEMDDINEDDLDNRAVYEYCSLPWDTEWVPWRDSTQDYELTEMDLDDISEPKIDEAISLHMHDSDEVRTDLAALAAWELADLGEVAIAVPLLIDIANAECRSSETTQKEGRLSAVFTYTWAVYWAIVADVKARNPILNGIASNPNIDAAVRLVSAIALGVYLGQRDSSIMYLNELAENPGVDSIVRLSAADAIASLGAISLAEKAFQMLMMGVDCRLMARHEAMMALERIGRWKGAGPLVDIVRNINEDIQVRLEFASSINELDHTPEDFESVCSSLGYIALDGSGSFPNRTDACNTLSKLDVTYARKILILIAGNASEDPYFRVRAAHKIAQLGSIESSTWALLQIASDTSIALGARRLAEKLLDDLGLK